MWQSYCPDFEEAYCAIVNVDRLMNEWTTSNQIYERVLTIMLGTLKNMCRTSSDFGL